MTLVGFLRFAVKCFNVLAWPLCSLGYPLCASIRAIESNSNADIQNLVTYWVSFSLISLVDHAFANLLHWNPFWPYMKLFSICWLLMPHFDGSLYVYKHFIHPCLSGTPEFVMNRFSAWKEFFLSKENFLVAAERYIEENGAEALEKLIANQLKCTKPKSDVKKVKAVDTNEKNADSPECKEPNVLSQSEIKIVEVTEKKEVATAKWVDKPEVNLSHAENKTYAVIKGATAAVAIAVKEIKLPAMPAIKTVQNEWTCAPCQVTTPSETVLNSHLQGRKHKAKIEELKAKKEETKNNESFASITTKSDQPKVESKKYVPSFRQNKDAGLFLPLFILCDIESNLNSDMQKLVTYWVLFSLILLFELALVKVIEWIPFWPYVKLMAIFLLVIPSFNGASFVYVRFAHRWYSVFINQRSELLLEEHHDFQVQEIFVSKTMGLHFLSNDHP